MYPDAHHIKADSSAGFLQGAIHRRGKNESREKERERERQRERERDVVTNVDIHIQIAHHDLVVVDYKS